MKTEERLVQFAKDSSEIIDTPSGIITEVRPQFSKAQRSILKTVLEICTEERATQFKKANLPILVTPSSMITCSKSL